MRIKMKRIKKTAILMSLFIFLSISLTSPVSAGKKRVNISAAFGAATFFFDEPIVDLGVEFQLSKGFYGRLMLTTSFGSSGYPYNPYYYGSGYGGYYDPNMGFYGDSMVGVNAIAAYKHRLFKRVRLLWQAGVFFMYYREYNNVFDEISQSYGIVGTETTGLGALGGTGFEFILAKKIDLVLAGVYHSLFNRELLDLDNGKVKNHWLKFYLGINYRIK
jgi:hypothetical protein